MCLEPLLPGLLPGTRLIGWPSSTARLAISCDLNLSTRAGVGGGNWRVSPHLFVEPATSFRSHVRLACDPSSCSWCADSAA